MQYRLIDSQVEFDDFCARARRAGEVAFDTEFVSESSYQPELCLLQFATRDEALAVDPYAVTNLEAWWELMTDEVTTIVVHGGREEVKFCLRNARRKPRKLVDVQVAEGLHSRSFPLNYTALVGRVLGMRTDGSETRTDWRRRPLTEGQLRYAIEDVQHLLEVWDAQKKSLERRGRLHWAEAEFQRMIDEVEIEMTRENWRRLPGITGMRPRELAVIRALFDWREQEAVDRNKPARKVLRDDLIVELGRRQPADVNDLLATRDMNRSDYRRVAPAMLSAIAKAQQLPPSEWPTIKRNDKDQDEQILAQLLSIALANRCAQAEVAVSLVGTSADLRHLVRWYVYGEREGGPPRITQGWRAEVCGDLLTDVLAGKIALRVSDPQSDHPLTFEKR